MSAWHLLPIMLFVSASVQVAFSPLPGFAFATRHSLSSISYKDLQSDISLLHPDTFF